jgi:hypothetical protein
MERQRFVFERIRVQLIFFNLLVNILRKAVIALLAV